MSSGPLAGVRVIESAGWCGAVAGRLLADGGAEVVRLVPSGDPLDREPPWFDGTNVSIQATWYNAGKRLLEVDAASARGTMEALLASADIVLDEPGYGVPFEVPGGPVSHIRVTPFGSSGPWAAYRSNDLVGNALSGAASVTGDATTPPLTGYGNQSYHSVGLYAAICALAGLRFARATGNGMVVDLSGHEALVSCTEQVLMQWFFPEAGNWNTPIAERLGSLHWSRAYEVYPGRGGRGIMVTASLKPVEVLLPWLQETGDADDILDPEKYPNVVALIRDLPHVMDVLRRWVAKNDADELFLEAQRRHLPFGAVWDMETVVQSRHLEARRYFQAAYVPGAGQQRLPGRYFRTSADGPHPSPARRTSAADLGWPSRRDAVPTRAETQPDRPLEGIRVLDFTHVLAGPFGTRVLGDLGADIIKVGSAARSGGANSAAHPYYVSWNRNKRSVSIDMGNAAGRKVARDLADRCDVVIDNFSAGVLKRCGLDHESIAQTNPKITCISMAGMGNDGPWRDFVTFAPTIHALAGLTYLTGVPGRHDIGYGFSLTDHLSGLASAVAALEGVEHARRTGRGLEVDLSQYELGLGLMGPALIDHLANGANPEPAGNRHPYDAWAPHGIYPCAGDEAWVAIACRGDGEWAIVAAVLGIDPGDPFESHTSRIAHQAELDAAVAAATKRFDRYELMERLQRAGIAAGVVQNAADLTSRDPQLDARGFFGTAVTEGLGEYGVDRFPALLNGTRPARYDGTVEVGANTFTVLSEVLGLDDERIAALVAEGALS